MDERIRVQVVAVDPAVRVGVDDMVQVCPELTVVVDRPDVVLMVTDEVGDAVLVLVRSLSRAGRRVLLVADRLRESDVVEAVEAGAGGLLRRCEVSPDRLRPAIRATADGSFTVPSDLLTRAADRVPERPAARQLTKRERAVLLMLADGHETEEIARSLAYSVRTVTGIVHTITRRWQVRNRAQAVACALREGLI
ncbi:DNA-binding NarL/FixJ family response regulator [Micromonospora sp. M71_S20]|uniref:LuxR C-terminal-related transcriptional regulator n=1 Tax=Micromonospora sp. M71_S20 TaxID=592872 RepID=UPI000EACA350|nr:response regulator transcription factor [Micromonospora sp. M71_S20]RLK09858.1 DNA-binding NarL/FixJ family response regulator [Micromonospora sp. M71_S20]